MTVLCKVVRKWEARKNQLSLACFLSGVCLYGGLGEDAEEAYSGAADANRTEGSA